MSKDVAARLHALALDHREGRLSLTSYRNLRAPLLDLLTSQSGVDGVDHSLTTQRGRAVRARMREDHPPLEAHPPRRGLRIVGVWAAAVITMAAVTVYSLVSDVRAPASEAYLGAARETSQTLGDADEWSGARMHSLLAEFDGRAVCRKELAGSPEPFCRDLLATADAGPQLLVLTASSGKAAGGARRRFAISLHEISQAQFRRYCAHTTSRCRQQRRAQDDAAVVNVTLEEARQYLVWLSEMSGQEYRLPTVAEWQQGGHDGKTFGWRAVHSREWFARGGQDRTSQDDQRSFRVVRELQ